MLLQQNEDMVESEPFVKFFRGKQPFNSKKNHFANRKKKSEERADTFSRYKHDYNSPSVLNRAELVAVGKFRGTLLAVEPQCSKVKQVE